MKPDPTDIGDWSERVNRVTNASLQDALIALAELVEEARDAFRRFGPVAQELSGRMRALEELFVDHDTRGSAPVELRSHVPVLDIVPAVRAAD